MTATLGGWLRKALKTLLINVGVLIGLYAALELGLHIVYGEQNPFLNNAKPRIPNAAYTHTFKAKFDGFDKWFRGDYPLRTNSLGFKDATTRDVPLVADRKRILFIGDSFTEGLGLTYEESFVGRFAQAFPGTDVLNAGVSSYAPSAYYEKLKFFLENGLRFDEAIVYIDISDIQDEAVAYAYDANGVLHWTTETRPEQGTSCIPFVEPEKKWWEKALYVVDFFDRLQFSKQVLNALDHASLQDLIDHRLAYYRDSDRSAWTYSTVIDCYGEMGVEGGIEKAKRQMDRLYDVLSQYGVPLSVGVYPWPYQLLYDEENSRQVQIWRDWCAGKCKRFFNHFPAFFRYKERDPGFMKSLFIWGDVHFNAQGAALLADDLIAQYRR